LSNNIQRKQAQEALQAAYTSFRRQQARDLLETLPEADRKIIELDARAKSQGFIGTLAESMFDHHKAALVAQRYADKLPTFEQWQARPYREVGPLTEGSGAFDAESLPPLLSNPKRFNVGRVF
jgi:hypothetical protein